MRIRVNAIDDQTGIELNVERNIMTATQSRRRHLRGYARSIGNLISVSRKAVSAFRDLRIAGNVTRSDNHWENKLIRAIFVLQSLNVADCDLDLITGQNICYRLREDVRPFLIKQTRCLST